MTHQEKLQALTTAIQEVVPSVMERENKMKDELYDVLGESIWCTRTWDAWSVGTMTKDDFQNLNEDEDFMDEIMQILGSPITLANVLEWMYELRPFNYAVTNDGWFYGKGKDGMFEGISEYKWNLKETLENQSPETIDFLFSLIK